jgi:hypothetical protein
VFYAPCNNEWYQGDIVSSFPFILTDLGKAEKSSPVLFEKPALVISQTCDLQRRPFVQVCPIHDFEQLKRDLITAGKKEEGADSFIASIRGRKVNYYFYLSSDESLGIKEGYADIGFISTVARQELIELPRIATLNAYPRQILAYQTGNLFLRPH